jgi:hypothetical protein
MLRGDVARYSSTIATGEFAMTGIVGRVVNAEVAIAQAIGGAHRQRDAGSDDAVAWARADGRELHLAAAVSDGHSDKRCFRSRDGARFATRAALQVALGDPAAAAAPGFMSEVVSCWRALVDDDLRSRPPTADELNLSAAIRPGASADVQANPRLIYGATLLVVQVDEDGMTVTQIGDGDVIAVGSDGGALRLLGTDPAEASGLTSSLSQADAAESARSFHLPAVECPALVMLASDGLDNAYPDGSGLLNAGRELLERSRLDGRDAVRDELLDWAAQAAAVSGDDATVALLWLDVEHAAN